MILQDSHHCLTTAVVLLDSQFTNDESMSRLESSSEESSSLWYSSTTDRVHVLIILFTIRFVILLEDCWPAWLAHVLPTSSPRQPAQEISCHVRIGQPACRRKGALRVPLMRNVRCALLKDSVAQWEVHLNRGHEFELVHQPIWLCVFGDEIRRRE